MEQHYKTRVVIVGAGPTGLSMAAQLLRYNIDFIILEKNEKTTHLSKALAVQARTLEIFDEIDLASKAISTGQVFKSANALFKGKIIAHLNISQLGEGVSKFPFVLCLEQSKTEKLLLNYIIEHNKQVQWQSTIESFDENEKGVVVYYKNANAQHCTIEANYLIGCDGAHSQVRHQLGFSFEGSTVPKLFYVADVKLKCDSINNSELYTYQIKKGFILFFPMEGERHYRIVGVLPDAEDKDFVFSDVEHSIRQAVSTPIDFEEVVWFSSYKVHSRMARSFAKAHCFIAGDAAHIHTPAGGQGMNTGIQDAYNLAWKLAYVLQGKSDSSILKTYNVERMSNAKHLLRTTDRMFDLLAGSNWLLNFIRLNVFPLVAKFVFNNKTITRRFFPLVSQTGIAYPDSELTIKSKIGNVKAGDRMHYFLFSDGSSVFDFIKEPSCKVLFFGAAATDVFKFLDDCKIDIVTRSFSEIHPSIFKAEKNFYILLRPDNHIAYIGKDALKINGLLKKYFTTRTIKLL